MLVWDGLSWEGRKEGLERNGEGFGAKWRKESGLRLKDGFEPDQAGVCRMSHREGMCSQIPFDAYIRILLIITQTWVAPDFILSIPPWILSNSWPHPCPRPLAGTSPLRLEMARDPLTRWPPLNHLTIDVPTLRNLEFTRAWNLTPFPNRSHA